MQQGRLVKMQCMQAFKRDEWGRWAVHKTGDALWRLGFELYLHFCRGGAWQTS